jgi:hypothetical protein
MVYVDMFYSLSAYLTYPYKHRHWKRGRQVGGSNNDDTRSNVLHIHEECAIKSTAGVIFAILELHDNANYIIPV